MNITITDEAADDIESASDWYEEQRLGLGMEWEDAVLSAITRIGATPFACALIYKDVRRYVVRRFPYVLYYRVEGTSVVILACLHGRRHPRSWQGRL
jgi:plasmid stabilization system protein ParE